VLKYLRSMMQSMRGLERDWQCFRCHVNQPPSAMSLDRASKRWFCSTCIHPDVIHTPYVLTPEQAEAISLCCKRCDTVFLSNDKTKLEGDKSTFVCDRCRLSEAYASK